MSTLLGASAPASPPGEVSSTEPRRSAGLFRAFWRWHFYASIIVIPVFVMLSVTGLVILFKWQIDPAVNPGVMSVVQPAYGSTVAPSAQEAAAMAVHPGATVTAAQFGGDDRTTAFTMELPDCQTRNVYVNRWTAEMTGDLDPSEPRRHDRDARRCAPVRAPHKKLPRRSKGAAGRRRWPPRHRRQSAWRRSGAPSPLPPAGASRPADDPTGARVAAA